MVLAVGCQDVVMLVGRLLRGILWSECPLSKGMSVALFWSKGGTIVIVTVIKGCALLFVPASLEFDSIVAKDGLHLCSLSVWP